MLDALPAPALARLAHLGIAANSLSPADRRATLMTPYALGGWNAEAMATLGYTVDDALSRLDALHVNAQASLGWVCSALGRGRDVRAAFASGRAFFAAREDWASVAAICVDLFYEAHLPYFADEPAERERLVAEMDEALARHAAQGGAPPQAQVPWPLLALEGRWAEMRTLLAATSTESVMFRGFAAPRIGGLAHAQGEPGMAWGAVRAALPDGPATAPGTTHFMPTTGLQRLAATLALDAADLPTAREWLEAHDRWLAWRGAVRGRSEGERGWAGYPRARTRGTRPRDRAAPTRRAARRPPHPRRARHRRGPVR